MEPEVKTSGMKLSEIEPCSFCGGQIAPQFYMVEIKFALFGRGTNEVLGMTRFWRVTSQVGGGSAAFAIAEVMTPGADRAVVIAEDVEQMGSRLFLCQKCFLGGPVDLAVAVEMTRRKREELPPGRMIAGNK